MVPLWAAVYLAGSRRVNPILRGLVLAGAVLSVEVAVLTQSRGAMVAMAVSLPVFFLLSGQRLRGLFALAPIAVALLGTFPGLNEVYLAFLNEESAAAAIERHYRACGDPVPLRASTASSGDSSTGGGGHRAASRALSGAPPWPAAS